MGALVLDGSGRLVARGRNRAIVAGRGSFSGVPIAHAEIDALRKLRLEVSLGAQLISTLQPCPMCLEAAHWAGVTQTVFMAPDPAWSMRSTIDASPFGPRMVVIPKIIDVASPVALLLPLVSFCERLHEDALQTYLERLPRLFALAREMATRGRLRELAAQGLSLAASLVEDGVSLGVEYQGELGALGSC